MVSDNTKLKPNSPEALRRARQVVLSSVGGATWRIIVPATIGVGFGMWADIAFGTKPWLTLVGLLVAFAAAAFLIYKQIKEVRL